MLEVEGDWLEVRKERVSAKGLALVFGALRLREAKYDAVGQAQLVNTLCAFSEF